jgi:hypothetical protein
MRRWGSPILALALLFLAVPSLRADAPKETPGQALRVTYYYLPG